MTNINAVPRKPICTRPSEIFLIISNTPLGILKPSIDLSMKRRRYTLVKPNIPVTAKNIKTLKTRSNIYVIIMKC